VKRPVFWIVLAAVSVASAIVAVRYFPRAFSIVTLDITMDRERALAEARALAARDALGPAGFRQAASFSLDDETQTFVELEGGGKDAFTAMMRDGLYSAYTWHVRHFHEGEINETTIRFTPEGRPYGFVEKLREDVPGPALDAPAARDIAERAARAGWNVDLGPFTLVEQGQERRVGGRVDHTFTYERATPTLIEGRYRLRLVVSGDRLSEVTHFVLVPEAFERRYASMRSANEAIGIGSVVGMALLYVIGGIGVGLFFMLRRRWVVWRAAAAWGLAVGAMQALAMLNELPLLWMGYDTALPRSTFLGQQIALVAASFIGFSVFFGLSFMAAETLTRRAFGHHPQLWRAWSRRGAGGDPAHAPGASTAIAGRTIAGYLLVAVFVAYDVILYFVATRYLGWWSPAEALLHPDVLATYAPWLSAVANSFQAGFWEEALFRAVPLAGAALIGDRFGRRKLFLALGFVVQAAIFGAGHAPYPAQPSFARPVELILPSIGFGLLYVYFGLVPGIVLHYAFDAVLFALPIFLADAPGIWFQQLMVAVLVLVPLWVVLWRRVQVGRWTELTAADRNAGWTPPAAAEHAEPEPVAPRDTLPARWRRAWLAAGGAGLAAAIAVVAATRPETLPIGRQRASDLAREAFARRGAVLDARWRVMPVPDNGAGGPHEFVSVTAGEARRQALVGRYLPAPRWQVRAATFQGDVAARAEEWRAYVTGGGEVRGVAHKLAEAQPGASLDEAAARRLAHQALRERLALDPAAGQVREISAQPAKRKARTDWTFTFVDATVPPLPQGEPRVAVDIAGDEIVSAGRFIYVPEDWQRRERATATRNLILRLVETMIFAGLLVGTAVAGVIQWSRGRYAPRLFLATAALMLLLSFIRSANLFPTLMAALPTAAPLPLQLIGVAGIGLVGLAVSASLVGLVFGSVPVRLARTGMLADREALRLSAAAGFLGAGAGALAAWIRTPPWAQMPDVAGAGAVVPVLQAAVDPLPRLLMVSAVVLPAFLMADNVTAGWTRRRSVGLMLLGVVGFAAAGTPLGLGMGRWVLGGLVTAVAFPILFATLMRFDMSMVPLAAGTMIAVGALAQGMRRAYPGALTGSLAGAVLAVAIGWWCFSRLRRAARHAQPDAPAGLPAAAPAELTEMRGQA
jgi:hypothetical protein